MILHTVPSREILVILHTVPFREILVILHTVPSREILVILHTVPFREFLVILRTELKTLEWDILNPDLSIYLKIKFMRKKSHI